MHRHLPPLPVDLRKNEREALENSSHRTILGLERNGEMAPDNPGAPDHAALGIDRCCRETLNVGEISLRALPQRGFPIHQELCERSESYYLVMPKR